MPSVTFRGEYLHTDIFEMAAAYLFHIVKNRPFIDGNKRVGAVSTLIFLAFNGYDLTVSQDKFASFVIGVAKSDINKAEIALFFRKWAEKL
jgi:death-on-curing protein